MEKKKLYFYCFNLQKIYTREKVQRKKKEKQKERVNNWVKGTPQQHTILFWDLLSF